MTKVYAGKRRKLFAAGLEKSPPLRANVSTKLGVESSRSVSLIRNLTYLTKSFELGGRGGGSKL